MREIQAEKFSATAIKCLACTGWFEPEPETNRLMPMCPWCLDHTLGQHNTGATIWRVYEMVDLTPQGVGPFATRQERNTFFANMTRTHPHLVGRRIDCIEEPVEARKKGS